ncbi:hypothetical protein NEDG_01759 [Nematocida displodere]|uniref:Transmembrane protein n=1 Tax=Nematocida displodere TaxID=1805483 RepID=A0A177EEN6_9MICR|nr:hypothetical protein NEDG_01759 [Nematocida displodere]
MEVVWSTGLVGLLAYGNYRLFEGQFVTILWALCYDALRREVKRTSIAPFYSLFMTLSLFPALVLTLVPSVVVLFCGGEMLHYGREMLALAQKSSLFGKTFDSVLGAGLKGMLAFLEVRKDEELSETLVYYKIYAKGAECVNELVQGTEAALGWLGHLFFFLGVCAYFLHLPEAPLSYLFRPLEKGKMLSACFSSVVHSLCAESLFNCFFAAGLSFGVGSPFICCGGVLAAALSLFPVLPLGAYTLPGCIYLVLRGRMLMGALFLGLGVVQGVVISQMAAFRSRNRYLRTVGVALGIRVFGLIGAVMGPFLVFSLMSIWPSEKKLLQKTVKPSKTMEILRKNK